MRKQTSPIALSFTCLLFASVRAFAGEPYRPVIDPANFTHVVNNPYYPLTPGITMTYIERDNRYTRENKTTVTRETKTIMGVKCVVVRDTVTLAGAPAEETFNWYAQDKQGNVWCFGEATREFKTGGRINTAGSWEAGVKGAQPGIVMPAHPKVGDRYRQEYAVNDAEDIGQIAALNESTTVPFGTFTGCVVAREWSMLESGTSKRWYAKGIGLVRDENTDGAVATLVSVTHE